MMSKRTKWILFAVVLVVLAALVYHGPSMGF